MNAESMNVAPPTLCIAASGQCSVTLHSPADSEGFRMAARCLHAHGIEPCRVQWHVAQEHGLDLFDEQAEAGPVPDMMTSPMLEHSSPRLALQVPLKFAHMAQAAALHQDPSRFALLYELLWRLQHEPALRSDPLDAQWLRAERMARAVQRDLHKMKAFVRLRPVARGSEPTLHVAWFEPGHHIVEAVAPFFMRRFTQLHWAVLTPLRSIFWNGQTLTLGPGAQRDQAPPPDAGEALWLTYYEHIFNPARLKLAAMQKEMPRRYWKNLPEAVLIQPLAAGANERWVKMVERWFKSS